MPCRALPCRAVPRRALPSRATSACQSETHGPLGARSGILSVALSHYSCAVFMCGRAGGGGGGDGSSGLDVTNPLPTSLPPIISHQCRASHCMHIRSLIRASETLSELITLCKRGGAVIHRTVSGSRRGSARCHHRRAHRPGAPQSQQLFTGRVIIREQIRGRGARLGSGRGGRTVSKPCQRPSRRAAGRRGSPPGASAPPH